MLGDVLPVSILPSDRAHATRGAVSCPSGLSTHRCGHPTTNAYESSGEIAMSYNTPMTSLCAEVIDAAHKIAQSDQSSSLGTGHVLLGFLSQLVSLDELTQRILDLRLQLHFRSEVGVVGMEQAINTALKLGTASDLIASLRRSRERIDDAIVQLIRRS